MSESSVQAAIRLAAPYHGGAALWRNNSGATVDATGRMIRYGLGNDSTRLNSVWKSSDLIGVLPVIIQPYHVGRLAGIFMAVEVKDAGPIRNDAHTRAQGAFLENVRQLGGVGFFAQSVEDFQSKAKW